MKSISLSNNDFSLDLKFNPITTLFKSSIVQNIDQFLVKPTK
jgi:hypothetical protein